MTNQNYLLTLRTPSRLSVSAVKNFSPQSSRKESKANLVTFFYAMLFGQPAIDILFAGYSLLRDLIGFTTATLID
jgi:hypothetical protein